MTELLPAANVAPSASLTPPRGAAGGPPLRVMSFNVRFGTADDGQNAWSLRYDLLVRTIRRFDPDLLGVQEALAFQWDDLCRGLDSDYAFHGAGREDGRRNGESVGVFFRRHRFQCLDTGHFWLSETPGKPGSIGWDAELTRMASWVRLRDVSAGSRGGGAVLFLNTHWDHFGKCARFESAKLIRRKVREIQPQGAVVIVGDFNAREDDEEYAELLRAADDDGPRYVDAYRAVHPSRMTEEASFHGFKGGKEGSRIDWIFHSEDLEATEANIDRFNVDGRYPSDHFPVTAVLVPK